MFKDGTSQAVALVALGSYVEDLGVRDGCDEDMPEYKLAKDFVLPPEYVMEQGWAHRPLIGMMYGAKYIERYKAMLTELFARGSKKSSSKMGPGMMRERLVQLFPGVVSITECLGDPAIHHPALC
jgi:hypothetical protein